ncbi:MAG: hypothetical protein Q9222_002501 [Ikaeria aurantiellina]
MSDNDLLAAQLDRDEMYAKNAAAADYRAEETIGSKDMANSTHIQKADVGKATDEQAAHTVNDLALPPAEKGKRKRQAVDGDRGQESRKGLRRERSEQKIVSEGIPRQPIQMTGGKLERRPAQPYSNTHRVPPGKDVFAHPSSSDDEAAAQRKHGVAKLSGNEKSFTKPGATSKKDSKITPVQGTTSMKRGRPRTTKVKPAQTQIDKDQATNTRSGGRKAENSHNQLGQGKKHDLRSDHTAKHHTDVVNTNGDRSSQWSQQSNTSENGAKDRDFSGNRSPQVESIEELSQRGNGSVEEDASSQSEDQSAASPDQQQSQNGSEQDVRTEPSKQFAVSHERSGEAEQDNENGDEDNLSEESGMESRKPEAELLDQDDRWREILEAKGRIGVSEKDGDQTTNIPKQKTPHVGKLVDKIKQTVKSCKEAMTGLAGTKLQDCVADLQEQMRNLSFSQRQNEKGEVVREIYAYAIPSMVDLLGDVLTTQSAQLSDSGNVTALATVISIQDLLIALCEEARSSRKELGTKAPIIRPTRAILPRIRKMRRAFGIVLKKRRQYLKDRENWVKSSQARETSRQSEMQALQKQRKNAMRHEQIAADTVQLEAIMFPSLHVSKPPDPICVLQNAWSKEQDMALIKGLFEKNLNGLSAEDRILRLLNTPALQNKLPEHLRIRSLYYKPVFEEAFLENGQPVPDWLSSFI